MIICKNDKLTVRSIIESDKTILLKWLTDKEVLKYYEGRNMHFDEKYIKDKFFNDDVKITRCIIENLETPIGYLQFYEITNEERKEYDLLNFEGSIFGTDQFIGEKQYWGQGIGTELMKLIINYLTNIKNADKIVLDPQCWNERAIKCYEKSGYIKVMLLPKHELHEGKLRDCLMMEYTIS